MPGTRAFEGSPCVAAMLPSWRPRCVSRGDRSIWTHCAGRSAARARCRLWRMLSTSISRGSPRRTSPWPERPSIPCLSRESRPEFLSITTMGRVECKMDHSTCRHGTSTSPILAENMPWDKGDERRKASRWQSYSKQHLICCLCPCTVQSLCSISSCYRELAMLVAPPFCVNETRLPCVLL